MNAPILCRISSVLLLLFAAGHTFGFRQNNPEWGADAVLGLMRSVHFDAQGFTRTYWDFFSAFGFFFLGVSFVRGGISVAAGRTSGGDFGTRARHCVGARHLLCSGHGVELEIYLHYPHRFLNAGYGGFDCGRVALGEGGVNALRLGDTPARLAVPRNLRITLSAFDEFLLGDTHSQISCATEPAGCTF